MNHVVLAGVLAGAPSAIRGPAGDVLAATLRTSSGDVPVEIRDPFVASLVFKEAVSGSGVFLTGSIGTGASGLVVVVENGRGHDVRIVAVAQAEVRASAAEASAGTSSAASPAHSAAASPTPTAEASPARSAPAAATPPRPSPANPASASAPLPPRPSIAGPGGGFRPGMMRPGARPGAAVPGVGAAPVGAAPAVPAPTAPRPGIGALGVLKSGAKPVTETEPDMEDPTGEETGPPAQHPVLPSRMPGGGGRFAQPPRQPPGRVGSDRPGQQDQSQPKVDPFGTISLEAEDIPF